MKKNVSSQVLMFRRPTLRIFSSLVPFFTEDMFILVHCSIHTLTCVHICYLTCYIIVTYCDCFQLQMAPKDKKRKAATKITDKPEELVMSEKRHNMTAYLDPEGKITKLKEMTRWIRESRINKVVTFSTPVYKSLVKAFWNSASVIQVDGTEFIQGQVNGVSVNVSPEILNTVLELQDDPNASSSIPIMCTRGCLLRMKCTGDIFSTQINKGDLPMRYKFLLHKLI
ncbi:hypothetical protein HanOQP8_Chr17g0654451 [Helianthus annuus]|nr:hypothetical protein HanOQP8_Chr17g0654451 [Helianthus annuus]